MPVLFYKIQRSFQFLLLLTSFLLLIGAYFYITQCFLPVLHSFSPFQGFACTFSPLDYIPLIVALGYWAAGAISWWEHEPASTNAFFLVGSITLSAGLLSSTTFQVAANIFLIALAILSPIILHFHLALLKRPLRPLEKASLGFFYLAGCILALRFALSPYHPGLWNFEWLVRILFMAAVLWTCLLLITGYNNFANLSSRRRIRLVAFGALFGFIPLVLLSVLPQTLQIEKIDFVVTFPGLLTIPIVYSYVAFRARLPLTEKRFRQIWLYYLLSITLLSVYFLVAGLLRAASAQPTWVYTGGVAALLVIVLFLPLRNLMNRLVMWIFYGSETDYAEAVHLLGERFAGVIERQQLQSLLIEELVAAVRPSRAVLFLRQPDGTLQWAGANGIDNPTAFQHSFSGQGAFAQYLAKAVGPVETRRVRAALQGVALDNPEASLLATPGVALWLPMVSDGRLFGLLLFGFRAGDDLFTEEDQRLLGRVTHQAGAAIRNVIMAEDLRAGQEELVLANQKLILGQEQERRRLARELHDDTVQQLLGISFRFSGLRKRVTKLQSQDVTIKPLVEDLELARRDLLDVVSQLRGMIGELRPAGLEELGLRVALEGYIEQLRKQSEPREGLPVPVVELLMDEDIPFLSDTLAICLFRLAQEALRNAFQHAQATHITLCLNGQDGKLQLVIQDNGYGFQPLDRLSEYTQANHYGLVGMWERVRAAGGEFRLTSQPGAGACIQAILPLEEKSDE